MIQIDHVTFSYGEETEHTGGVRDIELRDQARRVCRALRRERLRKTTITRLINGLIPIITKGSMSGGVWVNGLKCQNNRSMIRRKSWAACSKTRVPSFLM